MASTTKLALAAALFALASASMSPSGAILLRAEDVLNRPYASLIAPEVLHERAESNDSSSSSSSPEITGVQALADGSLNLTEWESATNSACVSALSILVQSTNPSGACVCYNMPSLDTETGIFEADLRLYKISEPRGTFSGIASGDVSVSMSYNGASVMPVDASNMTGAGFVGQVASIAKRSSPELLQTYNFVGQIDKDRLGENMTMSALEAILLPTITLTGRNSSGVTVQSNVSVNEASFLTGVFSNDLVLSDFGAAQLAVDEQLAGLKNGTVAFILPGTQLMVYPIGLIITGTWMLVGLAVYGFGTYERLQYAEMYRRRQAVLMPRGMNTI